MLCLCVCVRERERKIQRIIRFLQNRGRENVCSCYCWLHELYAIFLLPHSTLFALALFYFISFFFSSFFSVISAGRRSLLVLFETCAFKLKYSLVIVSFHSFIIFYFTKRISFPYILCQGSEVKRRRERERERDHVVCFSFFLYALFSSLSSPIGKVLWERGGLCLKVKQRRRGRESMWVSYSSHHSESHLWVFEDDISNEEMFFFSFSLSFPVFWLFRLFIRALFSFSNIKKTREREREREREKRGF